MPIDIVNELTTNANGGTELTARELQKRLDPALLDKFQIIPSRVRNLDPTRKKILWLHDLPGDPECEHLKNGGYTRFDKLVFVSNWQMQAFINMYGIPWYKCVVMQNAINPLEKATPRAKDGKVKIIYHTTPHRGLNILTAVFDSISKKDPDVHLDVFSSFKIYGWEERDEQFREILDFCKNHPQITYHGAQPNATVREALTNSHIFAYPSIWPETSCIALLEAMSAGLECVHSNYAALPETAANWTRMYQYQDNLKDHAKIFAGNLRAAIEMVRSDVPTDVTDNAKSYTDIFYNWDLRAGQWNLLLKSML